MYFTATSPYVLMFVLLIRGVTLEGASTGLRYYLLPEWSRLLDPQVWQLLGEGFFFVYFARCTLVHVGNSHLDHLGYIPRGDLIETVMLPSIINM